MPNRRTHMIAGGVAGLGVYALRKWFRGDPWTWEGAFSAIAVGVGASALPDILEPAWHPNHRGFFHSVTVLAATGYGAAELLRANTIDERARLAGSIAVAGFASHLLLDATTPKSLPIFGL